MIELIEKEANILILIINNFQRNNFFDLILPLSIENKIYLKIKISGFKGTQKVKYFIWLLRGIEPWPFGFCSPMTGHLSHPKAQQSIFITSNGVVFS